MSIALETAEIRSRGLASINKALRQECEAYRKRCEDAEFKYATLTQSYQMEMNNLRMEIHHLRGLLELANINPDTGYTML